MCTSETDNVTILLWIIYFPSCGGYMKLESSLPRLTATQHQCWFSFFLFFFYYLFIFYFLGQSQREVKKKFLFVFSLYNATLRATKSAETLMQEKYNKF